MRVTVRRRVDFPDGTSEDEEVTVETGWTGSDQLADCCARAWELWGWCFEQGGE